MDADNRRNISRHIGDRDSKVTQSIMLCKVALADVKVVVSTAAIFIFSNPRIQEDFEDLILRKYTESLKKSLE